MPQTSLKKVRSNSSSTIRAPKGAYGRQKDHRDIICTSILWTHDDTTSSEHLLFRESWLLENEVAEGTLVMVQAINEGIEAHDFQPEDGPRQLSNSNHGHQQSFNNRCLKDRNSFICYVRSSKTQETDLSMLRSTANAFAFKARSCVLIERVDPKHWTASHIELSFRDSYLSRSDMWRFACQSLVDKVVYAGQRLSVVGSMKATVKKIHVNGKNVSAALFTGSTVPVFRSEAARYVIFVQMSREMWDFDSEGNGEIMFNRVVNGFLPELFKKWSALEVRHLVSIVMFGRLEYDKHDIPFGQRRNIASALNTNSDSHREYQDFYRVVVTDMASAQWTTILDELKKDFRVFLRDVSLFEQPQKPTHDNFREDMNGSPPAISGRLSTALKGNILEAINLAASQFSNDYIDRDLIRTGISTVVVTAGTGVFDVDRELLDLTSETLTNNGIGIDIVCLSKMPLHSVPLFRYLLPPGSSDATTNSTAHVSPSSSVLGGSLPHPSLPDLSNSPAFSATTGTSLTYFSRFPSAFPAKVSQLYGYGIPQWIDLSYWSPPSGLSHMKAKVHGRSKNSAIQTSQKMFQSRVRMYEVQMMGLMEMGMADIAIGYLQEEEILRSHRHREMRAQARGNELRHKLSQSPELGRKSQIAFPSHNRPNYYEHDQGNANQTLLDMSIYDERVFTLGNVIGTIPPPTIVSQHHKACRSRAQSLSRKKVDDQTDKAQNQRESTRGKPKNLVASSVGGSNSSLASVSDTAKIKRAAIMSRNFSSAFRSVVLKSTALKPAISMETVNAQALPTRTSQENLRPSTPVQSVLEDQRSSPLAHEDPGNKRPASTDMTVTAATGGLSASKPIKIMASTRTRHQNEKKMETIADEGRTHTGATGTFEQTQRRVPTDQDNASGSHNDEHLSLPSSVPESRIPFVRNVNASNPLKRQAHATALGRWQHLYPRRPQAATVKWKSLCTPASVPLTTEDFPTPRDFELHWIPLEYTIAVNNEDSKAQDGKSLRLSLILELLSVRLAHGYQLVVGDAATRILGAEICNGDLFFNPVKLIDSDRPIVLIMGNTIQKLDISNHTKVTVTKYVRKLDIGRENVARTRAYEPYIRTILADAYGCKYLCLKGFTEQYPWELADHHIISDQKQRGEVVENLRFWRARFVLLPVEPPANTLKLHQNGENEEEIRLLGIRALTQLWLRNKYSQAEDKESSRARLIRNSRRDQNPLEIKMETLDPSELVAAELDRLVQHEDGGENSVTQLLPESQRLNRDSPVHEIAQLLQTDQGIEIKNRRWHWRLHYSCFRGEELTTWLLMNVKDLDTRDEAVELGNQLMNKGLFEHVNDRHNFKDGHYFYSLKNEFRQSRADQLKSWLPISRQTNRSIPHSHVAEDQGNETSSFSGRIASSALVQQLATPNANGLNRSASEKHQKVVSLSRMIRVDVDPRKKSFFGRPEIVNVHYDRFHNPENCYHLELNWHNTTCKLVDDAIVNWTNTAEKFGLKLVEVPISEAFDIPKNEPFRNPYRIKLAIEPPKQSSGGPVFNHTFFTATSFAPQQSSPKQFRDKHTYQKALLKRFNFVLDLEAAADFPDGVDILYSWGRLDYKYTQFVHRSGVLLAQILEDGDIIVLANRLYNSRLVNTKEVSLRFFESKKNTGPQSHRTAVPATTAASVQASGVIGVNLVSPSGTLPRLSSPPLEPSPIFRPSIASPLTQMEGSPIPILADTFGPKAAREYNQYITPEQIKDDLQAFCSDKNLLEQFYKEVASTSNTSQAGSINKKAIGSGSSSLLRPVREAPGVISDIGGIPAFELPESITAMSTLRRATVAYENVSEMMGRLAGRVGPEDELESALNVISRPPPSQNNTNSPDTAPELDTTGVDGETQPTPTRPPPSKQASRARAISTARANTHDVLMRKAAG